MEEGALWREQKPVSIFAIFAVLYSTVAVALQHALSADQSLPTSEYLGQPVFGDVTLVNWNWFVGWMAYRGYVVLPAICALAWAMARRNPYIILGYAAFVPWALLHLVAARNMLGTLPSYYAFPFMLALAACRPLNPAPSICRSSVDLGTDRWISASDCGFIRDIAVSTQSDAHQSARELFVAAFAVYGSGKQIRRRGAWPGQAGCERPW
jgi:hypothetical protein